MIRSLTSSEVNISKAKAPAMLGSIARRSGREAARQRIASTAAVATAATAQSARWALSTTSAAPASGKKPMTSSSCSSSSIQTSCSTSSGSAKAAISSQSTRDCSRPPLRLVSTSGRNAKIQMSEMNMATVAASGASIWVRSG